MKQDRRRFLGMATRMALAAVGANAFGVLLGGCKTMEVATQVGTAVGTATGVISGDQAESIQKAGKAVARSFEDFTPEQEYTIGRAVGAQLLERYPPYDSPALNTYLNTLGQALALASDMPETFNGYHFLALDSDQINAFAAPGGMVFVTRGLLRCCRSEDAAAAVLAHEIGHVQHRHGMQAIEKSRITEALSTVAAEGAKSLGGAQLAQLTRIFEGTIADITATLVNAGYSRAFESQADQAAVTIMARVGYDGSALVDMLEQMKGRLAPGGLDFAKTHPSPQSRIDEVRPKIRPASGPIPEIRRQRFARVMASV